MVPLTPRFAAPSLLLLALLAPGRAPAQASGDAVHRAVVQRLADSLRTRYVFPEVGRAMADRLEAGLAGGEFDGVREGEALAERVTAAMHAVRPDGHLALHHSEEVLGDRTPDDPEVERAWRERARSGHFGFAEVRVLPGNVGVLELRYFAHAAGEVRDTALAAMRRLAGVDALIVDLRRNTGGDPTMVALLSSQLFDGDEAVHLNDLYDRVADTTITSWTEPGLPVGRILGPVYTVTSGTTFSAAEEFVSNLKHLRRAVQVGEVTGGGAHPGAMIKLGDHFQAFIPSGRAINPVTGSNWEGTGNRPEVAEQADAALDRAYRLALLRLAELAADPARADGLRQLAEHAVPGAAAAGG